MNINILESIEYAAKTWGDKVAYTDDHETVSFNEVLNECYQIGSELSKHIEPNKPVIILLKKSVHVPSVYLGVVAAGCYYVPLDIDMPLNRLKTIIDIVNPEAIFTDKQYILPEEIEFSGQVFTLEHCLTQEIDTQRLINLRKVHIDTDPLYVIFTSGSTGVPKGVITSHRSVINYINVFVNTFNINSNDILGNQAPLDYVAAIRDIYIPLFTGAQTVMIPKRLFSTPRLLFDFVNNHNVTTLCWVAPALSLCSELNVFEETTLVYVNKVFFTGSVMPCKHLIVWQKSLPDSLFVNHYGPTEITASCSYYIVDHIVNEDEVLPIGVPFSNMNMFLLSETNESVPTEDIGEICVRGPGLALGYFNDLDRTKVSFTNNPLNTVFPETIYRTGDLGSIDENGIMHFHGRLDTQIKHMGHRIELLDIEAMTLSLDGISNACCIYDQEKSTIWLFYSGLTDTRTVSKYLRERLPAYMVPRKYEKIAEMPKLMTGKIDINILKTMIAAR